MAKHANMISEQVRLNTFNESWPHTTETHPNCTPQIFAANGFFYTGIDDACTCFFCGISLKEWQPTDTVLGEHVKHNPNCAIHTNDNSLTGNVPMLTKVNVQPNSEQQQDDDNTSPTATTTTSDQYVKTMFISDILFSLLQREMNEHHDDYSSRETTPISPKIASNIFHP